MRPSKCIGGRFVRKIGFHPVSLNIMSQFGRLQMILNRLDERKMNRSNVVMGDWATCSEIWILAQYPVYNWTSERAITGQSSVPIYIDEAIVIMLILTQTEGIQEDVYFSCRPIV
jgi:hypothetical protein